MAKNIAPAIDRAKVYMAIGISLDDAMQLDDDDENPTPYFEKLYEGLDELDKEWLAQYVGEWLYSQDQFTDALKSGLDTLHKDHVRAEFDKNIPLTDIKLANE